MQQHEEEEHHLPHIVHTKLIKTTNTNEEKSLPQLNKLITLYSKHNQFNQSLSIFRQIPFPNVVSWTALISGSHNPKQSLLHFVSMLRHPTRPNERTLCSVLRASGSVGWVRFGQQVHCYGFKVSLSSRVFLGCAIVGFYMKCRRVLDARKVFDEMPQRDEVCYSNMVGGLAQNCRPLDALSVFKEMVGRKLGFSMVYSVSGALTAAAELACLEQCRAIHCYGVVSGVSDTVYVRTGLISAYGKCGMVSEARRVFDESLYDMNIVGWNAMMAACARQGDKSSVIELFWLAESRGLVPDKYSFLAVLTSLYNAGLADEAKEWINEMKTSYRVEPLIEHYTCLIGALGRVGRLDEAERIALTMPIKPDAGVWRVLLSASAANGAPKTAWRMSKRLLELDPYDDSAYVIAANAFLASGRGDVALAIRKKMNSLWVKKEGGRSWIEVRGEVHVFSAGDNKHEKMDQIYAKLEELMKEIAKLGYVPIWSEMLQDVEEGEKREGLSYHSEKLALAFAVVSGAAPPGKPVRILKNLRICKDCHEAFKYFSRVLEKEIIVRDVNRYHTFVDGHCTCDDYW